MVKAPRRRNVVDWLIEAVAPQTAVLRQRARVVLDHMARAYEGASRADGWRPRRAGASANTDHRMDARELRARARALVQNVPYVARALQVLVSATIGTGLVPRFTGTDAASLNALWKQWARVADADGTFDLAGLQAAAYRAMLQDGEVLIRRRPRRPTDGLPVPLQVQLLEIDWLDSSKNGKVAGTSNVIINGIEYDALGKPRAYWLFPQHPGETYTFGSGFTSVAVPASDIIHLFAPTRPGQGRGISRLAPIVARTRDFMVYEDAELARKNLESRLGVIASGDADALANDGVQFGVAADPGTAAGDRRYGDLGVLPSGGITEVKPGLDLTFVEPKPAGGFVEYGKFNLHLIAAGIGVPYESMTGDMKEVNFSSARIRQIEFRRDVEQEQWLVLEPRLCQPLQRWFVDAAADLGKVRNRDYSSDLSTPRWDYVNPKQDVDAEVEAISSGLLTPSEALRRRGYEPAQVFAELGKDFEALDKSGALALMQFLRSRSNNSNGAQRAATEET
jgi:lambda family phage portal protein